MEYLIHVTQKILAPFVLIALLCIPAFSENGAAHRRWLILGCWAGVTFAFVGATLKHTTALVNREYCDIVLLSVSILSGILCVGLLWSTSQRKAEQRASLYTLSSTLLITSLLFYSLPDVFLYPTEFSVRGESVMSTDFLLKSMGYFLGILLILITTHALFRVSARSPSSFIRVFLTLGVTINIAHQIISLVQILLARHILFVPRWLFRWLIRIINYDVFFLYALLLITLGFPLLAWKESLRLPAGNHPAEKRKEQAKIRNQRHWIALLLGGYAILLLSLTALKGYYEQEVVLSAPEPIILREKTILLTTESLSDRRLHRFSYETSDGTEVRFIAIQKNDTVYGVGLDACDLCGQTGYYERHTKVVCKRCDVVMNVATIGFKGGCNPVPLSYERSGPHLILQREDLEKEKNRFK